jgi:hypothetical protein
MTLLFDWDLGNGMNLFIYYTSNLWHSLRGLQDRFTYHRETTKTDSGKNREAKICQPTMQSPKF